MKPVSQEHIREVLAIYREPYRFLREAYQEYPRARGVCLIGETPYTTEPIEHVAAHEGLWCMYQLAYAAFPQWIGEGRFPGLRFSLREFVGYQNEHMKLVESATTIRFREEMTKEEPLQLSAELRGCRRQQDSWFAIVEYQIEQGKADGTLKLVLKQ